VPVRAAFTVAANEEESGNIKHDTLRWPEGRTIDQSMNMAFEALFRQWGISYQAAKGVNACQQAMTRELRCLKGPGSLNELLGLNKPAVLWAFDERTATMTIAGETRSVGVDEIKKRWYGDYTLLWKHPKGYRNAVKPGYRGPEVEWIDRHLSLFEGKTPNTVKGQTYNGELVNRMKRFQIAQGLIPDGIVGPQTFIHLGNAAGANGPVLMKMREGR
jgi:general secretion pathway protein A